MLKWQIEFLLKINTAISKKCSLLNEFLRLVLFVFVGSVFLFIFDPILKGSEVLLLMAILSVVSLPMLLTILGCGE